MKSIIKACLQKNPDDRPKFKQLLEHPALKKKVAELNALIEQGSDSPEQIHDIENKGIDDFTEDHDDIADESSMAEDSSNITELSMDSSASKEFHRENWIRCASLEDFSKYMATEFGEEPFAVGFKSVNENKQLIYEDIGDGNYDQLQKVLQKLSLENGDPLFKNEDDLARFVDYTSLFILVNNMAV